MRYSVTLAESLDFDKGGPDMNKKILLHFITMICMSAMLTGCTIAGEIDEPADPSAELEWVGIVEATMKNEPADPKEIPIIKAEIVALFEEDEKQIVLANIYQLGFIPQDGIFLSGSGGMVPVELRYELEDGKPVDPTIIYPIDGEGFLESLREMSRGNEQWYSKLLESQSSHRRIYNEMILKLKDEVEKNDLEGYVHTIDTIPGYTENVLIFEDPKNEPTGNIAVVREEDYLKAKNEIGKVNWPHYEGILFNEATGLAMLEIFDDFPQ